MTFLTQNCACKRCVGACESRPGWPTPEEAERIIKIDGAKRLMLDWWEEDDQQPYTEILAPAAIGHEGQRAPAGDFFMMLSGGPHWRCNFLTEENKCELHGTDRKPFECRVAMPCGKIEGNPHAEAAKLWNTDKGREVVQLFKQLTQRRST